MNNMYIKPVLLVGSFISFIIGTSRADVNTGIDIIEQQQIVSQQMDDMDDMRKIARDSSVISEVNSNDTDCTRAISREDGMVPAECLNSEADNNQAINMQDEDCVRAFQRKEPLPENCKINSNKGEVKFNIKEVVINSPLALVTKEEVASDFTPLINNNINLSEVKDAVIDAEDKMMKSRQLIKADIRIPQQKLDGSLKLHVTEGYVNNIIIDDAIADTYRGKGILKIASKHLNKNQIIRTAELEKVAYRVIDYVQAPVNVIIMPTQTFGMYDIKIELVNDKKFSGSISMDNTGSAFTDDIKDTTFLHIRNPTGLSDQLYFTGQVFTPNQKSYNLTYQKAFTNAWKAGAFYQESEYELCCELKDTNAKGESKTVGIEVSNSIERGRSQNQTFKLKAEHFEASNDQYNTNITDREIDSLTGTYVYDKSNNDVDHHLQMSFIQGDVKANNVQDAQFIQNTSRIDGRFFKVDAKYRQKRPINIKSVFRLNTKGQWASDNLDTSEKLSLGGLDAVRAYPQGEALGDMGAIAQLEYEYLFTPSFSMGAFYDIGYTQINSENWDIINDNSFHLQGVGVSSKWRPFKNLQLQGIFAHQIGDNPLADANDKDSDGKDDNYRTWFLATWKF